MVSLPDSHVFELLARFPSSTYKIIEREVAPQNQPTTGFYTSGQNIRFNISAAVNEFVLVDSSSLDAHLSATFQVPQGTNFDANRYAKVRPAWRTGPSWIGSVRETVNTNSLVTYELTDKQTTNWYNNLRGALTRTNIFAKEGLGTYSSNAPAANVPFLWADGFPANPDADYIDLQAIERIGFSSRPRRLLGMRVTVGGNGTAVAARRGQDIDLIGGFACRQVPLTAIGSIFQSTSIVPLGLFSTYSGQSYGIEIRVAEVTQAISAGDTAVYTTQPTEINVLQPRISLKILKVLDETVMEAILQLYNKSESVEVVDNMKIPLSLQMNSLKYTYHQFSLQEGAQEYQISVPSTAASLRGFAFRIVQTSVIDSLAVANPRAPENNSAGYPLCDATEDNKQAIIYKFQVKVGSECIMESAVEQSSINIYDGNTYYVNPCINFFAKQAKKSGHLFSLLHHSKQANDDVTGLEDITMMSTAPKLLNQNNERAPPGFFYSMNLENVNHFENNNQASGIDMRNYGSYQIIMKVGVIDPEGVGNSGPKFAKLTNLPENYTVLLMNAEDVVYEVSRSGVADVTSQVL